MIAQNAGLEGSIVVNKVREGKDDFGYNAATDKYGNLLSRGVIDPVKVVRTALQNAASVAGLMLTTECLVAERPKEEKNGGGGRTRRPRSRGLLVNMGSADAPHTGTMGGARTLPPNPPPMTRLAPRAMLSGPFFCQRVLSISRDGIASFSFDQGDGTALRLQPVATLGIGAPIRGEVISHRRG